MYHISLHTSVFFWYDTGSPSTIDCCFQNTSKWNLQLLTSLMHSRLFVITDCKCIIFLCTHLSFFDTITASPAEYYWLCCLHNTSTWNVQLLTYLMHSRLFVITDCKWSYFFAHICLFQSDYRFPSRYYWLLLASYIEMECAITNLFDALSFFRHSL